MAQFAEIFLGILTAMGGFVEIGELTFTLNAGQHFGYSLLWVVALGTLGIMAYCEMAGRVAAVRRRAVFHLVRERAGFTSAALTLVAALAVNLLTCTAEIGGVALLLQLMAGGPFGLMVLATLGILVLVVWFVSFQWIERIYGLGGLLLVVYLVALVWMGPDFSKAAHGLVPGLPPGAGTRDTLLYFFYAVALLSSIMLPYETYFYASGGIEDEWKPKDVSLNRLVVLSASRSADCWPRAWSVWAPSSTRRAASSRNCPAAPRSRRCRFSASPACGARCSACSSRSAAPPSRPRSRVPTTSRNSPVGRGANTGRNTRPAVSRWAGS